MSPLGQKLLKGIDPWVSKLLLPIALFASKFGLFSKKEANLRPLAIRPGGMGDLICCHMALELLGIDPLSLDWLIERRSSPWAKLHGFSYRCYDALSPLQWIRMLGAYTVVINTEQFFGLSQVAALGLLHSQGKLYSFESNSGHKTASFTSRYSQNADHEVVLFAELFAKAFNKNITDVSAYRDRRYTPQSYAVLALGGGASPARNLSLDQWTKLSELASGNQLIVSGSNSEQDLINGLKSRLAGAKFIENDFRAFVQYASTAHMVLTIDSGVVHVASYYGVPTIALFTSGQEHKWAPLANGSQVCSNAGAQCRPCTLWGQPPPCRQRYQCKNLPIAEIKIES